VVKKLLLGLAAVPFLFAIASARQQTAVINGKEFIVHSRRAPVVVHRLMPPFWNKHITTRELKTGRIPSSTRR